VKRSVRRDILRGRFRPNDKLPSETVLAEQFGTSRLTMHRALRELAEEGLLRRRTSSGTRVADPAHEIVGFAGLLMQDVTWGGRQGEWLFALSNTLLEAGIALIPCSYHGDASRALELAHRFINHNILGAVAIPSDENYTPVLHAFAEFGLPVVVAGKFESPECPVHYVSTNHYGGGALMARHLWADGYRRFAALTASHTQDARSRMAGFCDTIRELGGTLVAAGQCEVRNLDDIPALARRWRQQPQAPEAVFCGNDLIAFELMAALHADGLRLPDDLAVAGMGDDPMGKAALSPLTTVHVPLAEEGALIGQTLLKSIRGELTGVFHRELDGTLVVRESCGCGNPVRPGARKPQTPNQKEACLTLR
jgi:GntR family transcriptional regulator, arabinose operon transcriptional repressor